MAKKKTTTTAAPKAVKADNWIKCDERQPDKSGYYFAAITGNVNGWPLYWNKSLGEWWDTYLRRNGQFDYAPTERVKYWQPLMDTPEDVWKDGND